MRHISHLLTVLILALGIFPLAAFAARAISPGTAITHHANGVIAQFSYGNGILHQLTQNARRLPLRSLDTLSGGTIHDHQFSFDAQGNSTGIVDGLGTQTRAMAYDGLDRLTSVSAPSMWGSAAYAYDAQDNLRQANVGSRLHTHLYDANHRLYAVTGSSPYSLG